MADKGFNSILVALLAIAIGILHLFHSRQPQPYLDEIFHIPQAQKYCVYKFQEWDPKITTLPGLYAASFIMIHIMSALVRTDVNVLCSVWWLRTTNILFIIANAIVLHRILKHVHQQPKDEDKAANIQGIKLTAFSLCTFPVLFFFTFLYYTDAGSTFFVLFMYYLSLKDQHIPASLAGVVSIIFRQTNVVWVVFVAGVTAIRHVQPLLPKTTTGTIYEIPSFIKGFLCHFTLMLKVLFAYGVVVVGFVVFVVINGGIVVGDRSSHVACFNIPQLFYFVAFSAVFSFPTIIDSLPKFLKNLKNISVICIFILSVILSMLVVYKFTYVHEYLLADNRHYPFYVWHKLYARHWSVRYFLVPGYLIAMWLLSSKLSVKHSAIWQLMYWVCVSLVLIPQKLFEFRYFILPYILYRIHAPIANRFMLVLEFALYTAINAATIYLFLNKPFKWDHEPSQIQRFMW